MVGKSKSPDDQNLDDELAKVRKVIEAIQQQVDPTAYQGSGVVIIEDGEEDTQSYGPTSH